MSKNKNDKNTSSDLEKLLTHVGMAACTLASVAVVAEAFEARITKAMLPVAANFTHAVEIAPTHHYTDMRKEEIRHTHISYGVHMRSQPVSGSV